MSIFPNQGLAWIGAFFLKAQWQFQIHLRKYKAALVEKAKIKQIYIQFNGWISKFAQL